MEGSSCVRKSVLAPLPVRGGRGREGGGKQLAGSARRHTRVACRTCPGAWYVASPPRGTRCTSMPAAFSSPSLASTCAASARRPSVSTAGACCSARSAGAARPRRAASQSARCSARPRAYGTNPSEYTRQRPAGDIAPPHGGNAPQDRREGAPRRADAPRRAAEPMRAVEEAPSTGQVLRLAWAWASVCVRVWWWWGEGGAPAPVWRTRGLARTHRGTLIVMYFHIRLQQCATPPLAIAQREPPYASFFFFF